MGIPIFFLLMTITILFKHSLAFGEPLELGKDDQGGRYIGKYIEYLNQKTLFLNLCKKWDVEDEIKERVLSGQLGSDEEMQVTVEDASNGYKATFRPLNDDFNERIIEWGIHDILDESISSQFIKSEKEILLPDFIPHAFWLRFKIFNPSRKEADLYLELDNLFFEMFDIYIPDKDGFAVKRGRFSQNMNEREIKCKNITFQIKSKPGLNSYYVCLYSSIRFLDTVPLRLWSKEDFSRHRAIDNLLQGIIIGIFLLLFFYSIFIYLTIRTTSYLYLPMLIFSQLVLHLSYSGFLFQYVWPYNSIVGLYALCLAFPVHFIFNLLFCSSLISTPKYTPRVDAVIRMMISLFVIIIISFFIVPHGVKLNILYGVIFLDHVYYWPLVYSGVVAIKRGNRFGIIVLIGLSLYFLSQIEWILSSLDLLPYRFINYFHIKGISYLVLMTLGFAYKVRTMEKTLADLYATLEDKVKARIEERVKEYQGYKDTNKSLTETTRTKIETVKEFLHANYFEDISRESLASAVDMSPDHLGRTFKQYVGEKLSDYLNKIRIKEAAKRLRESDEKVIGVAFDVGFESLRSFNNVFRKIMRMSPSDYRKGIDIDVMK